MAAPDVIERVQNAGNRIGIQEPFASLEID